MVHKTSKFTKAINLILSKPVQCNPYTHTYKVNISSEIIQKFHSPCITKLLSMSSSCQLDNICLFLAMSQKKILNFSYL